MRHNELGPTFLTRIPEAGAGFCPGTPAPIVVENCLRIGHFSRYGTAARRLSGSQHDKCLTPVRPTYSNWLTIAAPDLRRMPREATGLACFTATYSTVLAGFTMVREVAGKRVMENRGKRTPGVDDRIWSRPSAKWKGMESMQHRGHRALPLRRIYISKSNGQ